MTRNRHLPRQSTLALSLAAVLASFVPLSAIASPALCQGNSFSDLDLTGDASGTCTIASGVTAFATTGSVSLTIGNWGSVYNAGLIAGLSATTAVKVVAGSTVGLISNSGRILSTIGSIGNSLENLGTITEIDNTGTIGYTNQGAVGILNGDGTVAAVITQLQNTGGTIGGVNHGLYNAANGSIGSVTNSGAIAGTVTGIYNAGVIDAISNSGQILSLQSGVYNAAGGTITTLENASGGLISGYGGNAIYNAGSIGTIANSGVLAGTIANVSSNDLHFVGGSGSVFGTLTGMSGVGTIVSTSSNVVFDSGNLLLNDNVNVGTFAVQNVGATLQVNSQLTIAGDYSQGQAATLLIGVSSSAVALGSESDTGYGRLYVMGTATIAAHSAVTLTATSTGYAFANGQRFVVVEAGNSNSQYNASTLVYSAVGTTLAVTGQQVVDATSGHTDLVVSIGSGASSSSSNDATTSNAVSSLGGLQRYSGISDAALLNLYNASLAIGSTGEANRAGAQLSPTQQSQASRAAAAPTFDTLNIISAHTNSLRMAQNGASGIATGDDAPKYGVWGQAFGGHASQGMSDAVSGYSANYGGLLVGVDRAVSERVNAGAAFAYSNTLINGSDDNAGSSTRVNAYGLMGYASVSGEPWYLNVSAGVVQQRYNSTRVVDFTGFSGTAYGAFSGQQYVARTEFGYPLSVASMTVTPIASLTYSYLHQGAYTETGGNGAALAVDASHTNSLRSALGAKLEKTFSTTYGDVVPFAQLQWIHEFVNTRQVTSAAYAAAASETAFTTVGASPVSDLADLSLGATLLRANNLSLTARYELQAGSGFISHTGTIRLRQLF